MDSKISKIKNRFNKEICNIVSYIDFMKKVMKLPNHSDTLIYVEELKKYVNFEYDIDGLQEGSISFENANELFDLFMDKLSEIENKIIFFKNERDKAKQIDDLDTEEFSKLEQSVINYFESDYYQLFESDNKYTDTFELLVEYFVSVLKEYEEDLARSYKDFLNEYYNEIKDKKEHVLMKYCISEIYSYHIRNLEYSKDFFHEMDIRIKANNSQNTLNVYRQGFILLVATIDATVFDLVKLLLDKSFFKHISEFCSKEDKIKVIELKDHLDFDTFKNYEISKRLKGKYLKDIFKILKNLQFEFLDTSNIYSKLMESVNRRNVHIHNQGIIDKKYLEEFNIHNLNEGDVAEISVRYFEESCGLFENLIEKLCEWIDGRIN